MEKNIDNRSNATYIVVCVDGVMTIGGLYILLCCGGRVLWMRSRGTASKYTLDKVLQQIVEDSAC